MIALRGQKVRRPWPRLRATPNPSSCAQIPVEFMVFLGQIFMCAPAECVQIDENVVREIINHHSLRHRNIILFKEVVLAPTHLTIVME